MGHPVLRETAVEIDDPTAPENRYLAADMAETMDDASGTGLAAPQVHIPRRMVVYFVSAGRLAAGEEEVPLTVLINPELTPLTKDRAHDWEGCLSVPYLTGLVPRYTRIGLSAMTLKGNKIEREVSGFHARVLQHECDHLDGILYPQRMEDLSLLVFRDELRHGTPEKAKAILAAERGTEPDPVDNAQGDTE